MRTSVPRPEGSCACEEQTGPDTTDRPYRTRAGQVLAQPQLLDQVWGYDRDPSSNVVEVYVGYLRKKLRRDVVETIRGAGYRFRG